MNPYIRISLFAFILGSLATGTANELSLNGIWRFSTQYQMDETSFLTADQSDWEHMVVPGNWDTTEAYAEFVGIGHYQKTFTLPNSWEGKTVRLRFGAVYHHAKVWLNGQLLGEHFGGYTPFEFNITASVSFNEPNSLIVMADNRYRRGAWWAWGGISRGVTLFADEDLRIVYQHVSAIPDIDDEAVTFSIKYQLQNHSGTAMKAQLSTRIMSNAGCVREVTTEVEVGPKQVEIYAIEFRDKLGNYTLWDVDRPELYEAAATLLHGATVLDHVRDTFGIRCFEVRGEQFYLNGRPVRLNGVNRIHDHPDFGNTEPDALVLRDMKDIKLLGANFARLMHAPSAENLLDICDRLGFLLVGEIPVWGGDDPQAFPQNPLTKKWLKEMIDRDFNHPCIIGWSVGNELRDPDGDWSEKTLTPDQYGYVNSMLDFVEQVDPTRLKTYVSLTAYREAATAENEPFEKVDFICINSYGDAVEAALNTHKKFPGKPIFISEIGLKQIGGGVESRLEERLVDYMNRLKDFPFVAGLSIWSYNDYRSDYEGTPASGFREWGIVDERRNKKAAYDQLKAVFDYWDR